MDTVAPPGREPDELADVDRSNWRSGRNPATAFRHIAHLLPVEDIANAPDDVLPLPEAPDPLDEFRLTGPGGDALTLAGFADRTATDALLVLRDGKVVFESYANGMTARTPHIVMSMTKAVTGLIGGVLHHAGALDLDAPASDQVPEVSASGYRGVTTRQLLDMRADILWDAAELERYRSAANWDPYPPGEAGFGFHAFLASAGAGPIGHGGPFNYISSNTELAGWVFERATGRRFASLVSDLLWRPMGAADPACITLDRCGVARCSGGLCATARDFARLGQVMVDGGVRDGRAAVPRAAIDDVAAGGDRDAWRTGAWGRGFSLRTDRAMSYRSGWYVVDEESPAIFAMGTHGQNLFLDPGRRLVIVKLSSQSSPVDRAALALTRAAVGELTRIADARRVP